jgi:lipopolysaccharide heptosyltransferase II
LTSLVIQTAFLGDVVLTTPLLAALAERRGPVDVVTTPAAAPLLETHPAVRQVIPYDKRGRDRGIAAALRLARRLATARYEAVFLPHRSLRSAALAFLARVPRRVGFDDGWPVLHTETRLRPRTGHEIDRLLALVDAPASAAAPRLYPQPQDEQVVDACLTDAGIAREFVALAPGSIWGTKRWPYYEELAAWFAQRVAVVVVGGAEDAELGRRIAAAVAQVGGRALDTCGRLTLLQSAALIGRAQLLVTNDSAPLHFASARGTRVVALFGPTVPEFGFGPIGAGDLALGVADLACRPCSDHGPRVCPLGHHRCMRELQVATVKTALEESGALRRRD